MVCTWSKEGLLNLKEVARGVGMSRGWGLVLGTVRLTKGPNVIAFRVIYGDPRFRITIHK